MSVSFRSSALAGWLSVVAAAAVATAVVGCGGGTQKTPAEQTAATSGASTGSAAGAKPVEGAEEPLPVPAFEAGLPEGVRALVFKPFTGDFDEMVKRRMVRLGVTFNRSFYFIDKGVQRGAVYEYGKLFEDELNKKLKTGNAKIDVIFVTLPRTMLAQALLDGRIDAVLAQVTITPDKQKLVDFSDATRKNVSEVVVTGPGAPAIATVDDLSGQEVFVREGGTYHQSLLALNEQFTAKGKPPIKVQFAPGNLEDDDVLEMVNAGIIPITVVDDYLAAFWKQVFSDLTVHDTVTVRTGGDLAVAFRKNSPQLKAALNEFLAKNGIGSAFRNILEKRYLVSTNFVKNATADAERKKMLAVIALFQKYSGQYQMDYLLMGAQAFQESGLNQDAKSAVGAIGMMQLMPATGAEQKVGDITQTEANIHAGVKYMRFMIDQYFKNEPMDDLNKGLFAFASYNAGPGRIRQLRKEAEKKGLNPNVWFGNVEQVASERIGRETVTYVSNIYKYYVAYQLMFAERQRRDAAKAGMKQPGNK
jgi:membrane-bound lytic murein transglycosylase MltF